MCAGPAAASPVTPTSNKSPKNGSPSAKSPEKDGEGGKEGEGLGGPLCSLRFFDPREIRDGLYAFYYSIGGLPASCRAFFRVAMVNIGIIMCHMLLVFIGIPTLYLGTIDAKERNTAFQMLSYYGGSQLLLGLLSLYFVVNALKTENQVLLTAATWLIGSVLIFDVSVLLTDTVGRSLLQTSAVIEGDGRDWYINIFLLGLPFRATFLIVLLILWFMMVYYGSKARVDFGWRIFKLCGTNVAKKRK